MADKYLAVYIQPGASKNEIVGQHGDRIKIKIKAPAQDNKANAELIKFLAEHYDLPKKNISIVQGEKSRNKLVKLY